ncbi:MAG: tetratricopeptide repeat protein [Candidatus Ratteibacteria bacterium]|nr:tetratricopeptide repeat protein [Candidatus Ratteibacteria bacterium]
MKKSKKIKSAVGNAVYVPPDIFGNIYVAIIILIACSTALVMMPQAFNYVLIKLAIAQFLLIIIFVLWLYQIFEKGKISIYKDPAFIALGTLTIWLVINLFYSSYRYASVTELSRLLTCFALYFAVVNLLKREKDLLLTVFFIVIVFAGLSVHGVFDYFHNRNPVIISTFGNPNFFSAYLVTVLPVVLLLCIYNFLRKNFLISSLLFILTVTTIFLLYVLSSRGAWLALAVSVISLLVLFGNRILKLRWKTYIVIGLAVILFVGSGILFQKMPRIKSYLNDEMTKGTIGIRLHIWHGTLRMIQARPLLGWGMGTFIIVYPRFRIPEYFLNLHSVNATDHAHNEILQLTSEIGLIGLGIFLLFLGIILFQAVRVFNKRPLNLLNVIHAGLIAGAIALFVHNLTCMNLRLEASAIYFYLFLGLVCAVCKISKVQSEEDYFNRGFPKNKILLWVVVPVAILMGMAYTNGPVKLIRSSIHLKNAIMFRNQNKWNDTIREYNKAIYWDRHSLRSYYRLAFAYASINKINEALATYLKLETLAPNYADINYNMGSLYLRMGKSEEALKQLRISLKLNPYEPKTYCNIGAVYMYLGDADKALENYREAVEIQERKKKINPDLADFGGGYAGIGEIYYSQGKCEEAVANYQKAVQLGEKNVRILSRLGNCYFKMQDFLRAKQTYEELLEIDSGQTQVEEFIEQLDKIIKSGKDGNQ